MIRFTQGHEAPAVLTARGLLGYGTVLSSPNRNLAAQRASRIASATLLRPETRSFATSSRFLKSSRNPRPRRYRSPRSSVNDPPAPEGFYDATGFEGAQDESPSSSNRGSSWLNDGSNGAWQSLREKLLSTPASPKPSSEPSFWDIEERMTSSPVEDTPNRAEKKPNKTRKKRKSKAQRTQDSLDKGENVIEMRPLHFMPIGDESLLDIPALSHGLERVLFNPGPYHLQDPRSRVFNFDPYLASIMPVDQFDFDAIASYITSSKDDTLRKLSAKHGAKYCGSTSSMTAILSQFHFLLSAWRQPKFPYISRDLIPESQNFTLLTRAPAAAFAHYSDGVYAIDADKEFDSASVLSLLGRSMEKLLTLPKEKFEQYRVSRSHTIPEEEKNVGEAYHYSSLGDFMLRSQLDAHDPRLPGTGVFDVKTRAVVSVRMNSRDPGEAVGYEIRRRTGQWESFEREYYDMIRAAFLKYSLQVRMGRMDGIFVAYHNTQRIFGFQYISLSEMDEALHGTPDHRLGNAEFKASLKLFNELLNKATERFPGRTLRLHVETRPSTTQPFLYFFAEPVTEEKMQQVQESNKASVEKMERKLRRLSHTEDAVEAEEEEAAEHSGNVTAAKKTAWDEITSLVKTMLDEEQGIRSVKAAVELAFDHQEATLTQDSSLPREHYIDSMMEALTMAARNSLDTSQNGMEQQDGGEGASSAEAAVSKATQVGTEASENDEMATVPDTIDVEIEETENGEADEDEPVVEDSETELGSPHPEKDHIAGVVDLADRVSKLFNMFSDNPQQTRPAERVLADITAESKSAMTGNAQQKDEKPELLALEVKISNKINGNPVIRPPALHEKLEWTIAYHVEELPKDKAQLHYQASQKRRKAAISFDDDTKWRTQFFDMLNTLSAKGKEYRERRTMKDAGKPIHVAWDQAPIQPTDVTPPFPSAAA